MAKRRAPIETWVVPVADGWDVRMEPHTGLVACGNERLSVVDPVRRTVKTVALAPARLLRWLTPQLLVWQHSTGPDTAELWRAPVYDLAAIEVATLDSGLVCGNTFTAADNYWASWLSNGLRLAAGTWTTGAPVLTSVYDSQLAGPWLVTMRDAGGMIIVWLKRLGGEWIVVSESAPLTYPQFWANPSGLVGVGYYGPAGVIAPGNEHATLVTCAPGRPEGIPRVIDVGAVRYVVTASYDTADQPVLYVRTIEVALDPARRTQEIAVVPLPFGFIQVDGRDGGEGRLELAGNDSAGHLAWLSVDVAALPVGPVAPGPEPPDPPTPPITRPPKVTITDYQPTSGPVPLDVRATWLAAPDSGPVDYVEWLLKRDGGGAWQTDAHNPSSDLDHTYAIRSPGVWLLALRAEGPGGTHQTGARRAVQATAAVTPIPPEPPMPDMLQTSAFRLASGSLLCADQQDGNKLNATRTEIGAWESFVVQGHPAGGAWVALKSDTGYVCVQATGHQLSTDGTLDEALALRLVEFEDDVEPGDGTAVALMASDGFYLWAEDGGGGVVLRNGSRLDDASTFAQVPGIEKEEVAPVPPTPILPDVTPGDPMANINTNFLALPGYGYIFMAFGESDEKFDKILDTLRQYGHTHIPTGIWGSYPGLPSFNYRNNVNGFRSRIQRCLQKGITPIVFGHTDGTGWNVDQVKQFQRDYFPKIADLTSKFALGWEFDQIDGLQWTMDGYKQLDLFQVAKETLPNARRYGHWGPERWAGGPDRIGSYTKDEYAWWNEARAKGAHGLLSNDNNSDYTAMMDRYHDIPAPHGYGPGIVGRMVGIGLDCVAFEMSRGDFDRHKKVVEAVKKDGRSKGWG